MTFKAYPLETISLVLSNHPEIPDDIKQSLVGETLVGVVDTFKNILDNKSEISDETKRAIISEINMNAIVGSGHKVGVTEIIADYLRYAADGKFDSAKKEMGKYKLLKPDYSINKASLSDEQIHAILWTCIDYVKEHGIYDDFVKQVLV